MRTLFLALLLTGLAAAQEIKGWKTGPEFEGNPASDLFKGDVQWVDAPGDYGKKNHLHVWIYLPPGYHKNKTARYPVLYACDGQNLFKPGPTGGDLGLDDLLEEQIRQGKLAPIIVVGVDDGASGAFRTNSYTIYRRSDTGNKPPGGQAKAYLGYLTDTLKPRIDQTFRTKPTDTAILGESLGGLFAIYASFARSDIFNRSAALSPSLWWGTHKGNGQLISDTNIGKGPAKLWVDIGDDEKGQGDTDADSAQYVAQARSFDANLNSVRKRSPKEYHFQVFKGAGHHEVFWRKRLLPVLSWLYSGN